MIGPGTLEQLRAASPYNIVGLTLPALDLDARAAGQIAAARLRDWLDEGVLAADGSPALYVYEQRGDGFVQRGLIGLVRVGTTAIHAHEDVMPGPVTGRRELMAAVHGNLEPILLVYNGGAGTGTGPAGTGAPPARSPAPLPPAAATHRRTHPAALSARRRGWWT